MTTYSLATKELNVEISDNESHGQHKKGYNGISALTSVHHGKSIFVPEYAGLNLEYFYNGNRALFLQEPFEPRRAPMTISQLDENSVVLYQAETPIYGVESWTTYSTANENAIDIHFRCILHKDVFPHGFLTLFWASYIHHPENKSIYFIKPSKQESEVKWQQFCTHTHGHESTVRSEIDEHNEQNVFDQYLIDSFSPVRFSTPMYYGRYGPMAMALLFEQRDGLRFTHSPTGAGADNPAWDFQFVINHPKVGHEFLWNGRMIYKPFQDRNDLLREYEAYSRK